MRRGRPPKPASLRALLGNAGHRPIPTEPRISRQSKPVPPAWLSQYGREAFAEVVDELFAAGIVTTVDTMALAAFAEFAATARRATEKLEELAVGDASAGLVAKMPSGAIVMHPILAAKNRAFRDVLRAASELGLSPSGRVGLQGVEPPDENDLAIVRKYQSTFGAAGHA